MESSAARIQIATLLKCQVAYAVAGSLFNGVSFWMVMTGALPLTPTPPIVGLVVMVLFACFLIPGYFGRYGAYRLLMGLSVLGIGYAGVLKHLVLISTTPEVYPFLVAAILGVAINVIGLLLNVLATMGFFRR